MGISIYDWREKIDPPFDLEDMAAMPLTPTKPRQVSDDDTTPTNLVGDGSELSHGDTHSEITWATCSSRCSPTKRSVSPRKREIALRMARSFPVCREDISSVQKPTWLMQELAKIRGMRLVPLSIKDRIARDSGWANPPQDTWFYDCPPFGANHTQEEDNVYIYRRIKKIRDNTMDGKNRIEYEVGWNEAIHWALLELALDNDACAGVCCRNVTQCGVYKDLRDPDALLADTKSDYALCLKPPAHSRLAELLRRYRQLNPQTNRAAHIQFSDEANPPPAVGIATKSGAQGASFVRGQFRYLALLPGAEHRALPILPTILVMYGRIDIGSSDKLYDCYVIYYAIRIIAKWCVEEYWPWLEQALSPLAQVAV